MSYATDVGVVSLGLARLGADPISSFDDGTTLSSQSGTIYNSLKKRIMSMPVPWHFAMKKVQLGQLVATPEFGWNYKYQLPADAIAGVYALYDSDAAGVRPKKDFQVYGSYLYTNYEAAYVDYKYAASEAVWPVWFIDMMAIAFAAGVAYWLTDNASLQAALTEEAFGPPSMNGYGGLMAQCININDMQVGSDVEQDFPLTDIRQ